MNGTPLASRIRQESMAVARGYPCETMVSTSEMRALLNSPPRGTAFLDLAVNIVRHPNVPADWAEQLLTCEHHLGLKPWEYSTVLLAASCNRGLPPSLLDSVLQQGGEDASVIINLIRNPSTSPKSLNDMSTRLLSFTHPRVSGDDVLALADRPELDPDLAGRLVGMLEYRWLNAPDGDPANVESLRLVMHKIVLNERLSCYLSDATASMLIMDAALSTC